MTHASAHKMLDAYPKDLATATDAALVRAAYSATTAAALDRRRAWPC